jgi:tellurite resistance protein
LASAVLYRLTDQATLNGEVVMKSIRTIVRPIVAALVFAIAAAPVTAFAGSKDNAAETKKRPSFPMTAESFNKLIEKRITHMRERLEKMMKDRKVPDAMQAQIKKDFEAGATAVRAAAAKAGADGSVTKDEAKQVKDLAKDLKQKAREKYMPGKGKDSAKDKKGHLPA